MKFEVVRKYDDQTMMSTEYESCVGFEYLDSQESAGYYFRLDGKKITAKEVKKRFNYKDDKNSNSRSASDNEPSTKNESSSTPTTRKVRAIRCINNGKTYKNMSEAGKDLGLDSALISYSLKVNRPTKGYSFEFVE